MLPRTNVFQEKFIDFQRLRFTAWDSVLDCLDSGFCRSGWPKRSVIHWLVGCFAGCLSSGDQHSVHTLLWPSCTAQKGWSGMLGSRHGHSVSSLQYWTSLLHSRLSVPVFACVLCHEMEWGSMTVPVEQCKYIWGKSWGGLGVLLGDLGTCSSLKTT